MYTVAAERNALRDAFLSAGPKCLTPGLSELSGSQGARHLLSAMGLNELQVRLPAAKLPLARPHV
jgi:hypothetical protein